MLFSTPILPTILVIISGIWQELEIKILHLFDLVKRHVKGTLAVRAGTEEGLLRKFFAGRQRVGTHGPPHSAGVRS